MTLYLDKYGKSFEKKMIDFIHSRYSGEMGEIIEYALMSGGKRLRPVMMAVLGEDLGIDEQLLFPGALAIEFIHNYSLIQDDLPAFDDDQYRRGRPSVHKQFGEYKAILASDVLITEAMSLFALLPYSGRIMGLVNNAAGFKGILMGQYLDMERSFTELKDLYEMYGLKTGKLFEIAFSIPYIIAELESEVELATQSAKAFGIAFQIHNDLKSKDGDKGILKILNREEASGEYEKYIKKAQGIFELIHNQNARGCFKEIWSALEETKNVT